MVFSAVIQLPWHIWSATCVGLRKLTYPPREHTPSSWWAKERQETNFAHQLTKYNTNQRYIIVVLLFMIQRHSQNNHFCFSWFNTGHPYSSKKSVFFKLLWKTLSQICFSHFFLTVPVETVHTEFYLSISSSFPLSANFTIPPMGPSLHPPMKVPSIKIAGTDVRPNKLAISARSALPSSTSFNSTTV